MKRHVERLCHQIAGLAHVAMARRDITRDELMAKLAELGTKITPEDLGGVLSAQHPELGSREMAELFFAMDTKLTFQLVPLETPTADSAPATPSE